MLKITLFAVSFLLALVPSLQAAESFTMRRTVFKDGLTMTKVCFDGNVYILACTKQCIQGPSVSLMPMPTGETCSKPKKT